MKQFLLALVCSMGLLLPTMALGQTTNITGTGLKIGSNTIATGTVCAVAVDANENPISVAISGGGMLGIGQSCAAISAGVISTADIGGTYALPDEATSQPAGFTYTFTVTDTLLGSRTYKQSFQLHKVPGITGSSFQLDRYFPSSTVITAPVFSFTTGSGAPSGACAGKAFYQDNTVPTAPVLYSCGSDLVFHIVTGSGASYTFSSGLTNSSGVVSPTYGATANTVAQGNDSRFATNATAAAAAQTTANSALSTASTAVQGSLISALPTGLVSATNGSPAPRAGVGSDITTALGAPPGLIPFGDSLSQATGATNASLGFVSLERNKIGGHWYESYYESGDMSLDLDKWQLQAGSPFIGGPNEQVEIGTNDVTTYASSANLQTVFQRIYTHILLWGAIPITNKVYAQTCTKTTGFATADNNYLNGFSQSSTTNGDVLTCTVKTGPNGDIALGYLISNGDAGTFTVQVNGVSQNDPLTSSSTWLAYGDGSSTITTGKSTINGFVGAVLTGFPANTNATVKFMVTSPTLTTNPVEIGWVGSFPASSTANPYVIAVSPNHQNNANDALSGTYAGFESALVTAMQGYGLNVIWADTRDGLLNDPTCGNGNEATMFSACYADTLHPNSTGATGGGHGSMARTILATLPNALVTNSPSNLFLQQFNGYTPNAATPVTPMNMPNMNPNNQGDGINTWAPGINFGGVGSGVAWISSDPQHGIYMGAAGGGKISLCQFASNITNRLFPATPSNLSCGFTYSSNKLIDMTAASGLIVPFVSMTSEGTQPSATSVNLFFQIEHITGTTPISTFVSGFQTTHGCVYVIPDALWTTVTGGNIAKATTAVVGQLLTLCYDGTLWYPSY